MNGLKFLIAITKREYTERYLEFFAKNQTKVVYNFCQGTANKKTLNLLGIDNNEKVIFETIVSKDKLNALVKGFYLELDIGAIDNGLAVVVPIDGLGGQSALKFFGEENVLSKEKEQMSEQSKNVLIITIADKGNTDLIMDSARNAGASGGTVVKAKGTGAEIAKFFGVSITEEKEMVYIVAPRTDRDAIMQAIMEKAGAKTSAHGVVFSLPVDKVVGIKHFEEL